MQRLTTLETDVMNAIKNSGFYNSRCDPIWSDCLHDSCKICKLEQLSGVVSSLAKKGLVVVTDRDTKDTCVQYTEAGADLMGN